MFLFFALSTLLINQPCPCGPACMCNPCTCLTVSPVSQLTPEQEAKIAIETIKVKLLIDSLKKPIQSQPIQQSFQLIQQQPKYYRLEQRCGPNGCYQVWVAQ